MKDNLLACSPLEKEVLCRTSFSKGALVYGYFLKSKEPQCWTIPTYAGP